MVSAIERFHCTLIGTYHDFTTPWPGGEPLNENAYWWLHNVVGEGRLTVVDNAWQTGERIIVRIVTLYRTTCICMRLAMHLDFIAATLSWYLVTVYQWCSAESWLRIDSIKSQFPKKHIYTTVATRRRALPVQVWMRIIGTDSIIVDCESGTRQSWNRTAQYWITSLIHSQYVSLLYKWCTLHYDMASEPTWEALGFKKISGEACSKPPKSSALCAEVYTNIVCPCCALASMMSWHTYDVQRL